MEVCHRNSMYDGCVLCMGAALIYVFLLPCTDVGFTLKFLRPGVGWRSLC